MSEAAITHNELQRSAPSHRTSPLAFIVAGWFVLVLSLSANEVFVTERSRVPIALLVASTAPVIVFLGSYWLSQAVRKAVLAVNLDPIISVQAWRVGGFSFIVLYSYGILPGFFAWPAGLGDMAIGATAPLMVALLRKRRFAGSKAFVTWNILGILDLVAAVGLGALGSQVVENAGGVVSTTPMAYLPLVLVPALFVPAFVILHLVALLKARMTSLDQT